MADEAEPPTLKAADVGLRTIGVKRKVGQLDPKRRGGGVMEFYTKAGFPHQGRVSSPRRVFKS